MKWKWNKAKTASLFSSLVLAGQWALILDAILVLNKKPLSVPKFAALLAVMFLLTLLPVWTRKRKNTLILVIAAVVLIPAVVILPCWYTVSQSVVYYPADDGTKSRLYGNQRVMLFAPHEDDDYNVLGGVIEEYTKYGSEVYVVFSTNGDYYGKGEERQREALAALDLMGVAGDHVIFLGYGDQSEPGYPHLYNGAPGQVIPSFTGNRETYGTAAHEAYRPGTAYTSDNFLSNLEQVITEYLPDVIYCVDYDYHNDHRALCLGFEKAMGRILNARQDYRPLVFKGYAYNASWDAESDFYGENLLATQDVHGESRVVIPANYRWEDRVRLPVHGESLSRSALGSGAWKVLSAYRSQGANANAAKILNGDKIFWQRQTESLCYTAQVTATSSDAALLHDFMLLDSLDLLNAGNTPWDGTWIPEETDPQKQVQVTFSRPQDVTDIVLYDNPEESSNVLNARITFDDGTQLETGPLDIGGAATTIAVNKTGVTGFTVTLLESQGQGGLTEIEAFGADRKTLPEYGKLMDAEGNFAYDYWIDPRGSQSFTLYTNGWDPERVTYAVDSPDCTAVGEGQTVQVSCPAGKRCILTVSDENGQALDRVCIQNPGKMERSWKMFWLRAEEKGLKLWSEKLLYDRLFLCRLYQKACAAASRIF